MLGAYTRVVRARGNWALGPGRRMKKRLGMAAVAVLSVVGGVAAEDYRCERDAGCTARSNENGEIVETQFRKGDLVSTDDGWVVLTDDGWVKIKPPKGTVQSVMWLNIPAGPIPIMLPILL